MIEGLGQVSALQSVGITGAAKDKVTPPVDAGFEAALIGALSDVSNQVKQAETLSISGIKGEASQLEVVTAVMEAEQKLQAAIAIRDKVIQAYLEVSRMQI